MTENKNLCSLHNVLKHKIYTALRVNKDMFKQKMQVLQKISLH